MTEKEIEEKILQETKKQCWATWMTFNSEEKNSDYINVIKKAISLTFEEAEKELSCTNCGKIMDKQFMSIECPECYLLGFRKQLDRELSEERKKIKEIFEKHFGEINSQQKNAPKNLEAMRETKYSRSELTESDNSVNGSERQTADTEPEKLEDGTNKPSPRVEIPRSGSLNSKEEIKHNAVIDEVTDGMGIKVVKTDGTWEKETEVCECGHFKRFHRDDNGKLGQCFRSYVEPHNCQSVDCSCKEFRPKKTEGGKE